jgi:hypothetical protein
MYQYYLPEKKMCIKDGGIDLAFKIIMGEIDMRPKSTTA